jgi:hypothetical protein
MVTLLQLIENVKAKTDLSQWVASVKQNPHDGVTWSGFADFLSERNGLDKQIGEFIQRAFQVGSGQVIQLEAEATQILNRFTEIQQGVTSGEIKLVRGQESRAEVDFRKGSVSVAIRGTDPKKWAIKGGQGNNINIADIENREFQLYYLFYVFWHLFQKHRINLKGNKVKDRRILSSVLINYIKRIPPNIQDDINYYSNYNNVEVVVIENIGEMLTQNSLRIVHRVIDGNYQTEEYGKIAEELANTVKQLQQFARYFNQTSNNCITLLRETSALVKDYYMGNLKKQELDHQLMQISRSVAKTMRADVGLFDLQ